MTLSTFVAWLALGLCVCTPSGSAFADDGFSQTGESQTFEALLARAFPGKSAADIYLHSVANIEGSATTAFDRLPLAQRNELAAAAARDLSLRAANGSVLTADVVDSGDRPSPPSTNPNFATLRELNRQNSWRINLLYLWAEQRRITEPSVIRPVIEMLEYPGKGTNVPNEAQAILTRLTGIDVGEVMVRSGDRSPETQRELADEWRAWWQRNRDKHLVVDSDVEALLTARIGAIELRLRKDLGEYRPITRLDPYGIEISPRDPLVDIQIDTRQSSAVELLRIAPDGRARFGGRNDYLFLAIRAGFSSPPAPGRDRPRPGNDRPGSGAAQRVEVLREMLPGTDIVITVSGGSSDPDFTTELTRSMKELLPARASIAEARSDFETFRQAEVTRLSRLMSETTAPLAVDAIARALVVLRATGPVVKALTSDDPEIRRTSLLALADGAVEESSVPAVAELIKSPDAATRGRAVEALGRIRRNTTVAVPALVAAAGDEVEWIRASALRALAGFGLPLSAVTPELIKGLSDASPRVRQAAISGLGDVCRFDPQEDAKVIPALMQKFDDADESTRQEAIRTAGGILSVRMGGRPPRTLPTIQAFLPQAKILVSAFINRLSDPSTLIRKAAARSLAEAGPIADDTDVRAATALIKALGDEDREVRASATQALKNLGPAAADAEPVLRRLAAESDTDLRRVATDAADRIRGAVYKEKMDGVLDGKRVRLGALAAPVRRADTTRWLAEAKTTFPGIAGEALPVRRATYRARVNIPTRSDLDLDFLAFKTQRGKIWIGWEMDFYLETESGILGGILTPYASVNWHTSLVAGSAGDDLDAAIAEFETQVNQSKVKGESDHRTELGENADRSRFFNIPGTSQRVLVNLVSVDIEGGQVRLVLKNPETVLTRTFWIDLTSRKVVKVDGQ